MAARVQSPAASEASEDQHLTHSKPEWRGASAPSQWILTEKHFSIFNSINNLSEAEGRAKYGHTDSIRHITDYLQRSIRTETWELGPTLLIRPITDIPQRALHAARPKAEPRMGTTNLRTTDKTHRLPLSQTYGTKPRPIKPSNRVTTTIPHAFLARALARASQLY